MNKAHVLCMDVSLCVRVCICACNINVKSLSLASVLNPSFENTSFNNAIMARLLFD